MADRDHRAADGASDESPELLFGGRGHDPASPVPGARQDHRPVAATGAHGEGDPYDPDLDGERSDLGAEVPDAASAVDEAGTSAVDEAGTSAAGGAPPRRSDDTKDGSGGGSGSFFRELPILLLIAFVLAFLLRTFVLQVFYIPSTSMAPTLQIDDRMVVEKLSYLVREPRRGEVVVFEGETFEDPSLDQSTPARVVRGVGQFLGVVPANARDFVKRVIGLPGDEVVIQGGQVFVNGAPLDEPYVVYPDLSDYGPVTVPEGHLFFLGDNRPNSSDSRRSLGMVPEEHVVGRAVVIIWPFNHASRLTGVQHDEVPDPATGEQ